jgi:hypothetical protein
MTITISVTPLKNTQNVAFHELELLHDCGSGPIAKHRNPVTDRYMLRCACGLEILLAGTEAQKQITYTAIDEQPRTLPVSEIQANRPGQITVTATRS